MIMWKKGLCKWFDNKGMHEITTGQEMTKRRKKKKPSNLAEEYDYPHQVTPQQLYLLPL